MTELVEERLDLAVREQRPALGGRREIRADQPNVRCRRVISLFSVEERAHPRAALFTFAGEEVCVEHSDLIITAFDTASGAGGGDTVEDEEMDIAPDGSYEVYASTEALRDPAWGDNWLEITDDAFARMTRTVLDVAESSCGGRVVSLLEGGYNVEGLASGVAAHIGELVTG